MNNFTRYQREVLVEIYQISGILAHRTPQNPFDIEGKSFCLNNVNKVSQQIAYALEELLMGDDKNYINQCIRNARIFLDEKNNNIEESK
jgi:hypothetical protein